MNADKLLEDFPEQEATEFDGEKYLSRMVIQLHNACDGAVTDDAMGYAGMHTRRGKKLGAKLEDGELMTVEDVVWCRDALPYYFNTQLGWVERIYFDQSIIEALQAATMRENRMLAAQEDFERMDHDQLWQMAVGLTNYDEVPGRSRAFVKSVQNFYRQRGYLSPKQQAAMARIMVEILADKCRRKIYQMETDDDA